jgi:hypothetical protein
MTDKVAFLFLTRGEHNNVGVWEKFFENVDNNLYKILIHPKEPSELKSPLWSNSSILRPIPTAWGTVSLVRATLYLLQMAFSDPTIKKFILLSESCLPTKNFKNIYDTIKLEHDKSRLSWTFGKNIDRYNLIKSYISHIPIHNWAKQSQWMCLDRKHVNIFFIPMFQHKIQQYLNDFKYCPAPDEHFFINFFLHEARVNINEFINHPITFVDWNVNSKHPKLFAFLPKDVIEMCRANKILFARKFARIEPDQLDIEYLLDIKPAIVLTNEQKYILDFFLGDKNTITSKINDLTTYQIETIYSALLNKEKQDENTNNHMSSENEKQLEEDMVLENDNGPREDLKENEENEEDEEDEQDEQDEQDEENINREDVKENEEDEHDEENINSDDGKENEEDNNGEQNNPLEVQEIAIESENDETALNTD